MSKTMVTHGSPVDHGTSDTGSVERLESGVSSRTPVVTTAAHRQRHASGHRAHQRSPHASSRLTPRQGTAATRPMTSRIPLDSDVATPRSDTVSPGQRMLIASRAVR